MLRVVTVVQQIMPESNGAALEEAEIVAITVHRHHLLY
jgi:hypothetical protein